MMIYKNQKGFFTLISMMIAGAIGIAIAITLVLLGIGSSRTSLAIVQSQQAKALVNTCAELALLKIQKSFPFQGTVVFSNVSGNCEYSVFNLGGENRLIQATGTVMEVIRKIRINVNAITPRITVSEWQEIP
ncbi:MAG TPA: hypothetical protein VJH70_01955 [Candidatus Paceibacterota bacterium]